MQGVRGLHQSTLRGGEGSTVGERPAFLAAASLLLVALTFVVYAQTRSFDFVLFDDEDYVYENAAVTAGLTRAGLMQAFRFGAGNWHPLTWISHMTDVELFGVAPGAHHVVSAAFHALNAVLLLFVLTRLTASFQRSLAVAAIFAVHPLNVENVAWIAERKTLLSMTFLLLALLAYERWAQTRNKRAMALVIVCFALGLMAKPYVITLPILLLLLDRWPLQRTAAWRTLIVEKIPLFALSAASAAVTLAAQTNEGAVSATARLPITERILNALSGYGFYLRKAFWPSDLSFFYPHPQTLGESVSRTAAVVAFAVMVVLSVIAWRQRQRMFGTAWAWFVITLVPVIGLVQVGQQAYADRYAYLPLIAIAMAFVWLLPVRALLIVPVAVVALAITAHSQASHWRNSETLFTHAIELDERNWTAWQNLGVVSLASGDLQRALGCFDKSLQANPQNALVVYNIGHTWSLLEQPQLARPWYERALALRPDDFRALVGLALTTQALGEPRTGLLLARRALELQADSDIALYALVLTAAGAGADDEALASLERLRQLSPSLARDAELSIRRSWGRRS